MICATQELPYFAADGCLTAIDGAWGETIIYTCTASPFITLCERGMSHIVTLLLKSASSWAAGIPPNRPKFLCNPLFRYIML